MFGSIVLDVVIGLVFIYLLYSLLATILQEIIATWLGFRAKILERAIIRMLSDISEGSAKGFWARYYDRIKSFVALFVPPNLAPTTKIVEGHNTTLANAFYKHPLIKYLAEDTWHDKPGYINAQNFSKVIVDLLKGIDHDSDESQMLRIQKILKTGKVPIKTKDGEIEIQLDEETLSFLRGLVEDAEFELEKFKHLLEGWFNDTMERATGWYKRHIQLVLLIIGFGISFAFNVDSIQIAQKLMKDKDARDKMVELAGNFNENAQRTKFEIYRTIRDTVTEDTAMGKRMDTLLVNRATSLVKKADSLLSTDLNKAHEILGLKKGIIECEGGHFWGKIGCYLKAIPGYLITALALSLGAPFWYDLLNKLMQLRGAGKKPEETTGASISATIQRKVNK
ncbi:hypothetical protein D3C72_589270 [compost metagenome]